MPVPSVPSSMKMTQSFEVTIMQQEIMGRDFISLMFFHNKTLKFEWFWTWTPGRKQDIEENISEKLKP